jgi:hypothetical protein
MNSTTRKALARIGVLMLAIVGLSSAHAQQTNPITDIRWSAATGCTVAGFPYVPADGQCEAPAVDGVTITGTPSTGQVPTATSGSAATWQTPTGSSAGFQYVWRLNCPNNGTTTGTTLFEWAKYSTASHGACVETTTTADGGDGAGASPIIGIVQSGAGTTGFAQIAVSGVAQCQFDSSLAPVQGALVQVSPNTAGECAASLSGPVNEDPETNVFIGTADAAGAAGAVTGVDLTAIVGNYGNYSAFTTPFLTMLCGANNGAQFAFPCALQQDGPTPGGHTAAGTATGIFPLLPFKFPYGTAANFHFLGPSNLGASGQDFELDTITHGAGSPPTEMFRMNASSYNVPIVSTINGTISVGASGRFVVGNSSGVFIWTLAGNSTIPTPDSDNAGHILYFEVNQAASGGPFTLTYPSNFKNAPTVSSTSGSVTMFSLMFDGTNYNCLSGCSGSGGGSGVPSVNGITTAVTVDGGTGIGVSISGSTITVTNTEGAAGVGEIIPGTGITCSPLVSGSCVGNVTVNSTSSGSGGPTGWMVDDFISQTENIFSLAPSGNGSSLTWTGGVLGHNGTYTVSSSGQNNEFEVFGLPFSTSTPPFVVGSGALFAVASLVEATNAAGGPVIFGYGDNPGNGNGLGSSGPNPPNEVSFHCDSTGLGNSHWFTFLVVGGTSAVTSDTGVSCLAWHTLEISDSGSTATFFIDGTSVGTATMPTTNYTATFTTWSQIGTSGNATMVIDWFAEQVNQTSFNNLK